MRCPSVLITLLIVLVTNSVLAQENSVEKIAEKDFSGAQNSGWEKTQSELGDAKGKLDTQVSLVKTLIAEKNLLNGEALALKIDELKKVYKKLEVITEEYNRINLEYLTKFPERGVKEKRIYKRIQLKSLQNFEVDVTLQGRVNKLHKKILNQYPGANIEIKNKQSNSQDKSNIKKEESSKTKENDVTDQINFKK